MGSQTEEGGDLTSQEEAAAVAAEEVEVEVGKEELLAGMTTMISALILDRLPPAGTCFRRRGNGEVSHDKILRTIPAFMAIMSPFNNSDIVSLL